jgi:hypothetical protein
MSEKWNHQGRTTASAVKRGAGNETVGMRLAPSVTAVAPLIENQKLSVKIGAGHIHSSWLF